MAFATGSFEVQMQPQGPGDVGPGSSLGRMSLDKQFNGDLQAVGKGEMLAARSNIPTSAAYVAIERVTGTLHGRGGSFTLVHRGVMTASGQTLSIEVVPDTGTDALAGLTGTLVIRIESGKHYYDFDYGLPSHP
ncbi:DUF3224 domain-containing protein [Pseudoxanthomonas gei]|uniref:DUF3224 domain-containing protein n=1 Tax=Pseudoxanthomonas gei TaxID=1383030 RepID=A0ABX0AKN3_9GAMM|nr:DUF3224 domain-containing protein [Pseudoxanthomonas gei]NDK40076.1 DUF3224 domain-containing protein [Pseudoxanthomonas gei]